ncbi:MAG: SDR family NAD(P)-dependent oxidoreductase [Defluviicoccus sp.]
MAAYQPRLKAPAPGGRLVDRVALITGASRGIGRAVALAFCREGALLALVSRSGDAIGRVAKEVTGAGAEPLVLARDLTDAAAIEEIRAAILMRWGRLDILVGNAADLGPLERVAELPQAVWDRVIALNLTANYRLIRAFDDLLHASDAGRAIFVTSAISRSKALRGAYAASKAGLAWLVAAYAAEVADSRLRVNLVDPGPTRTAMRAHAMPDEDPATLRPPEAVVEAFIRLAAADCTANGVTVLA